MPKPTRLQLITALQRVWAELREIASDPAVPMPRRLKSRDEALRIEPLLFWDKPDLG